MSSIGPMVSEKIRFDILMGIQRNMSDLGWDFELWDLFISIVSLGSTYLISIMTVASIIYK